MPWGAGGKGLSLRMLNWGEMDRLSGYREAGVSSHRGQAHFPAVYLTPVLMCIHWVFSAAVGLMKEGAPAACSSGPVAEGPQIARPVLCSHLRGQ